MNLFLTRIFLVLQIAAFSTVAFGSSLPVVEKGWEEISNEEGITVHRKEISDSDVVAFRGETVVDGTLPRVANVLIDTSRKLEWVAKIVEARDVRKISPLERIEYNHTATPWPLKDRDFVFRAKAEIDKAKGQMVFRMKSVTDPAAPEADPVRGELLESKYTLTSFENGAKTHVVVEIHADPKGGIPKWVVNLFQKSWPRKTLEGIKGQIAKADVLENSAVKAAFLESSKKIATSTY